MSTIYKLRDGYGVCVGGRFDGWLMRKHPDGQWVSVEKLELEAPKVPAFLQTAKPAAPIDTGALRELLAKANGELAEARRADEMKTTEGIAVRDTFIINRGLWQEFVSQLPDKRPSLESSIATARADEREKAARIAGGFTGYTGEPIHSAIAAAIRRGEG